LAHAAAKHGVAVQILATNDNGGGPLVTTGEFNALAQGIPVTLTPHSTSFYTTSFRAIGWLFRNVRKFDVVHTHALFSFMPVLAGWVCRMLNVPYIVRPLGTLNAYGLRNRRPLLKRLSLALIERPLLRRAFAVHCTSAAEVSDVLAACPAAATTVIPLPIAPHESGEAERASSLLGREADQVVLFLSRIDPKKNLEVLLEAFTILSRVREKAVLVVAGDGDPTYIATLRAKAVSLGIASKVVWAGHVSGAEKRATLGSATVFALPSHTENFGVAAAEALAAGVPCVLSPGVAIAERVAAAGAGCVAAADPVSTAAALAKYLDNPSVRAAASRCAIALAEDEFSADVVGQRLASLYQRAANSRHNNRTAL